MTALEDPAVWAETEFATAQLGDRRRVARLQSMAARTAARPHAIVADVFADPAERQAAYDFLEHDAIRPRAIVAASADATAQRCAAVPLYLVAADGCTLTYRDLACRRDMGSVGRRSNGARGLHVLDAVALTEQGAVLGLAGLVCWRRALTPRAQSHKQRAAADRETHHWRTLRARVRATCDAAAPDVPRVFLHDSGADAWPVLAEIATQPVAHEFTVVRAARDRRAGAHDTGTAADIDSYLWPVLRRAPRLSRRRVRLPAGHGRTPRRALLEYRAARVTLDLRQTPANTHAQVALWAVWVRERGPVPRGEERLEWLLLTDWPVTDAAAARRVVGWYLQRWRIEDFHKTWKRSGSDIEETQLGSRAAVERWMAIHAAVSARALRLVHQARDPATAAAPATTVLSADEIAALRTLRARYGRATPADLTVAQALELIAIYGGYTPQRGRRYGPLTLRRGLEAVEVGAQIIATLAAAQNRRRK